MSTSTITHTEPDSLSSIDDVVVVLEKLEHELPEHDLAALQNFNATYLIITSHVRQQVKKSTFQDPAFLEFFDTRFAYYYIDALRRYLSGQPAPAAWLTAFQAAKDGKSSFITMALGVNAHVNNDIPQVLRDCRAKARHYPDFKLVNDIISSSIYETINTLSSDTALISPQRPLLRRPYKLVMSQVVKLWRAVAWHKYKKYTRGSLTLAQLEKTAGRMATLIYRLPA